MTIHNKTTIPPIRLYYRNTAKFTATSYFAAFAMTRTVHEPSEAPSASGTEPILILDPLRRRYRQR